LQVEEDKPAKSLKSVKMTGYDEKQKVAIIKLMRTLMEDMNLVQVSGIIYFPSFLFVKLE